jgi:hypothetical protein
MGDAFPRLTVEEIDVEPWFPEEYAFSTRDSELGFHRTDLAACCLLDEKES